MTIRRRCFETSTQSSVRAILNVDQPHSLQVGASFEQVGGEAMAEHQVLTKQILKTAASQCSGCFRAIRKHCASDSAEPFDRDREISLNRANPR